MARPARTANLEGKRRVAPPPKETFYILDDRATDIVVDNKSARITDEMRENGIRMTADEAAYYVASGTIGTVKPTKSKAAAQQEAVNRGELPDMSQHKKPKSSS